MSSNVRPESMERITNFELAQKFIDEQIAEGKPEELEVECRFCNSKYSFTPADLL